MTGGKQVCGELGSGEQAQFAVQARTREVWAAVGRRLCDVEGQRAGV